MVRNIFLFLSVATACLLLSSCGNPEQSAMASAIESQCRIPKSSDICAWSQIRNVSIEKIDDFIEEGDVKVFPVLAEFQSRCKAYGGTISTYTFRGEFRLYKDSSGHWIAELVSFERI